MGLIKSDEDAEGEQMAGTMNKMLKHHFQRVSVPPLEPWLRSQR